jgi:hypothetical protein
VTGVQTCALPISHCPSLVAQESGEIELNKLPQAEKNRICKNITNASNNIIHEHQFRLAAGYDVAETAKAGNWEFEILSRGNSCLIVINVQGIYRGSSYNKTVTCGVRVVNKNSKGKYSVKWLAIGGGFDEGCRAG